MLMASHLRETPAECEEIEMVLGPFDVLNLETGDFNADFSGTQIFSNAPIAVFTGSEASDAPHFETLADRFCCADHLEDQLAPIRTAGKVFAIPHTPNRGDAARAAGADLESIPEPEYVRFVATREEGAIIANHPTAPTSTSPSKGWATWRKVEVTATSSRHSSEPVIVGQVMASQRATSVPNPGVPEATRASR